MAESTREERKCIPERISFDSLNRILIAYLKAGADKKAASYRDASLRSGVSHDRVSGNNKFFTYTGFLVEEGRGRFKLTERGAKYSQLLDWGRFDEAKDQLREILKECSLVNIVLDYVAINNRVTRDDLSRKIGSVADVPRTRRFTTGINALIDMLTFARLLVEEDEMLKKGEKTEAVLLPDTVSTTKEKKRPIVTKSLYGTIGQMQIAKPREVVPISLTINVTDITDIQKLKEILRTIKEELLEEKETE